jgi:hypothetical protein
MSNPFPLAIQENLPFFSLKGQCTLWESDPTQPPATIIATSESWGVKFDWQSIGALNHIIAGNWKLTVYLDMMGPGTSPTLPSATVAFVSQPNNYTKTLTFQPGSVPEGLYRLTTSVVLQGPGGPGPIAMMGDGPLIEFYQFP